jgi:hypothetical protein
MSWIDIDLTIEHKMVELFKKRYEYLGKEYGWKKPPEKLIGCIQSNHNQIKFYGKAKIEHLVCCDTCKQFYYKSYLINKHLNE